MKTVRPNEQDLAELQETAGTLKEANRLLAKGKKDSEAAKTRIMRWLQENRQINIDVLPIGEIIQIEGVCLIERGKQNKFDEQRFLLERPAVYAEFKHDFPINKFKPLV